VVTAVVCCVMVVRWRDGGKSLRLALGGSDVTDDEEGTHSPCCVCPPCHVLKNSLRGSQ
jgi:hypothetical protein